MTISALGLFVGSGVLTTGLIVGLGVVGIPTVGMGVLVDDFLDPLLVLLVFALLELLLVLLVLLCHFGSQSPSHSEESSLLSLLEEELLDQLESRV